MEQGMVKLITSDSFDPAVDVGARLMTDRGLTKQASTIFNKEYDELKPDKDHVGIHLVALGDAEHYPGNRNGDLFPKKACETYHHTFKTNGHVFRHHRNKDPKGALGVIKESAYNSDMGRIELFIHAHKEKAAKELDTLEKEGTISFSMAAKVPFDRCLICNTLRKSASDSNQCDHVKNHLGELWDDGRFVGTYNDEPNFFDISFVTRPADRIAWDLKKVASTGRVISSIDLAREYGVIVPEHVATLSTSGTVKLAMCKELAERELINNSLDKQASLDSYGRYLQLLRKSVMHKVADAHIDELRKYSHPIVFSCLASNGIILDPESFFKYAFGTDYGVLAKDMPDILSTAKNNIFDNLVKTSEHISVCDTDYFDVDTNKRIGYIYNNVKLGNYIFKNLVEPMSLIGDNVDRRVIEHTISGSTITPPQSEVKQASQEVKAAAKSYAAYKLSALKAISDCNDVDKNTLLSVAAVHGTL